MANEATDSGNTGLSETAQRYDRLRTSIPFVRSPDTLVVAGGLAAAFPDDLPLILTKVKEFAIFTEDNDPGTNTTSAPSSSRARRCSGR